MKATITVLLSIVIAASLVTPGRSFAQAVSDTMLVYASPAGNVNNVIMGDTTSTGQRADPNRVYVLEDTGSVDTTYFFTATMNTDFNLTIVGKTNPKTGHPPVVEPSSSSIVNFISPTKGNITLENLYFLSKTTGGSTNMKYIVQSPKTAGDGIRFVIDHCIFDNFNSYIINVNRSHWKIFVTNCEFRDDPAVSGGALWTNSSYPVDTLEFVNNTLIWRGPLSATSDG